MSKTINATSLFCKVIKASGFTEEDMNVHSRKAIYVSRRTIVCCVLRDLGVNVTEISRFVNIDRSSIYNLLKHYSEVVKDIEHIKEKIKEDR